MEVKSGYSGNGEKDQWKGGRATVKEERGSSEGGEGNSKGGEGVQ